MGKKSKHKKSLDPKEPAKPASAATPRPLAPQKSKTHRSAGTQRAVLCALLFIAVLAVFWPCLKNDFINCDDDLYVSGNPHVQHGFTAQAIRWSFTTFEATNWHPLTWLSTILACDLFGLNPAGHHFLNILLHAINVVLLFIVLELMTGARWRSFAVAALFAFHPLRVESVAWVAERKDVLCAGFWFLTIWAYVLYARARQTGERVRLYYGLTLAGFVLALLSKPMVVTLPFALLLIDYWPLGRLTSWRTCLLEKIPLFLLTIGSCVITYLAQKAGGAVSSKVPIYIRCETAAYGYFRYLGKMFWPTHLALQYPYLRHWPLVAVVLSAIGLVLISALAVVFRKKIPWFSVGWFWYVGTLVPVIGLVQVGLQSMADRYTYIPGIGIAIILVWGLTAFWQLKHLPINLLIGAGVAVVIVCAILTQRQIGYWQNSGTVFTHAIQVTVDNESAYEHLGDYEFKRGNLQPALDAFNETLRINPKNEEAITTIAYILFFNAGQRDEAIARVKAAVQVKPDSATLRGNLGMFYKEAKRYPEAEVELREALRLKPEYPEADVGLAYICMQSGRRDEAITLLKNALASRPDYKVAQKLLDQATSAAPR